MVDYLKLKAFVELTVSKSIREGCQQLMRLSGLGAMKPNMVVISYHEKTPTETTLVETCLLKDLKYSRIDRAEVVEYFTAADYMPRGWVLGGRVVRVRFRFYRGLGGFYRGIRGVLPRIWEMNGSCERLTNEEYVHILNDVLHINKSLCVARHFHRLDKETLRTWNGQKKFIDVWPVCMQKPGETGLGWGQRSSLEIAFHFFIKFLANFLLIVEIFGMFPVFRILECFQLFKPNFSSLFLLQLACILSMSSRWRSHTILRVFICVNSLQVCGFFGFFGFFGFWLFDFLVENTNDFDEFFENFQSDLKNFSQKPCSNTS
ncbi:unnamed protein product [Anisakis simplex]|uniref:SLC12A transporter C-terminal domain-containing protein n=1 Tax=Anisakis simplex TaxID=6269 RepID=A0A3P6TTH2_ANISI|nr:unnamed protein product [Anisakis simplex]